MSDQICKVNGATCKESSAKNVKVPATKSGKKNKIYYFAKKEGNLRSLPADIQQEIARLKRKWPDAFNAKFREYTADGVRFGCSCLSLKIPRNDTKDGRLIGLLRRERKLLTNKAFIERWKKVVASAVKGKSGEAKTVKCDCKPAPLYPFYPSVDNVPIHFRIFWEREVVRDPMDPFQSIMRPLYDSMLDPMRFHCHAVKEDEPVLPAFDFDSLGSYPDFRQIFRKNNNKFDPKLIIPSREQYDFLMFNPIRLLSL